MKKISLCSVIFLTCLCFGCSPNDYQETIIISFRYMQLISDQSSETGFSFWEDSQYPNLVHRYSYGYGHRVTQEEYDLYIDMFRHTIFDDDGEDKSFVGFYLDMKKPSEDRMLKVGKKIYEDSFFYYSFEG